MFLTFTQFLNFNIFFFIYNGVNLLKTCNVISYKYLLIINQCIFLWNLFMCFLFNEINFFIPAEIVSKSNFKIIAKK